MKYLLMILCASLFSVLAVAADANPGGRATYPSDGAPDLAVAPCNCSGSTEPTLAMTGDGVTNPGVVTAGGVAAPKPKASSHSAEKVPSTPGR